MDKIIGKSILGGIFIAIAANIYLKIGGIVGAIMFSIGLLGILLLQLKLYTGVIGYVNNLTDIKNSIIILLGNFIGSMIMLFYTNDIATELVNKKISNNLGITFLNACICGMLIYVAVEAWKKKESWIVPFAVSGFILFGAEHSIADMCFIFAANITNVTQTCLFLITVILGNAIGAIIINYFTRSK